MGPASPAWNVDVGMFPGFGLGRPSTPVLSLFLGNTVHYLGLECYQWADDF